MAKKKYYLVKFPFLIGKVLTWHMATQTICSKVDYMFPFLIGKVLTQNDAEEKCEQLTSIAKSFHSL